MMKSFISRSLSARTKLLLRFDYLRFKARHFGNRKSLHNICKLHLGCWNRKIDGWLNVDVTNSDYDVDLACGVLPFPSDHFTVIASQHVIEHLEMRLELIPLLRECNRVMKKGGEIWLSCPDMGKVCRGYGTDKGADLLKDKASRVPGYDLGSAPVQQVINELFHQDGEHRNLFDFELLKWVLERAGFSSVTDVDESKFLAAFPEFLERKDDLQTLYVSAKK
jgi:predicted SAM-dependent methyltransferase